MSDLAKYKSLLASAKRRPKWYITKQSHLSKAQKQLLKRQDGQIAVKPPPQFSEKLAFDAIFHNTQPNQRSVCVEFGAGTGDALSELADANKESTDYLGIEWHRASAAEAVKKIEARGLLNARLMIGDANKILILNLPCRSVDTVLIFFPDPCLVTKDHDLSLVNPLFLTALARVLKDSAAIYLATDVPDYQTRIETCFKDAGSEFARVAVPNNRLAWRPTTKYERLAMEKNHPIKDFHYIYTRTTANGTLSGNQ